MSECLSFYMALLSKLPRVDRVHKVSFCFVYPKLSLFPKVIIRLGFAVFTLNWICSPIFCLPFNMFLTINFLLMFMGTLAFKLGKKTQEFIPLFWKIVRRIKKIESTLQLLEKFSCDHVRKLFQKLAFITFPRSLWLCCGELHTHTSKFTHIFCLFLFPEQLHNPSIYLFVLFFLLLLLYGNLQF